MTHDVIFPEDPVPVATDSGGLSPARARGDTDDVPTGLGSLLDRLDTAGQVDPTWSELVDEAIDVWARPGFDTLISTPRLRFEPFAYQMRAATTVLRRMHGRAILADEVGLGKTIEAGLVLSELRMRGLAFSALVVTPPGLVDQWREELERKFVLPSVLARAGDAAAWADAADRPVVLASLATARRDPLRSELLARSWDLVVIDEAHRVRNPRTASGRLARALRARYLLLLSATPVENRLEDLFELVSLVSPGLLGTAAEFRRRHGAAAAAEVSAGIMPDAEPAKRGSPVRNIEELRSRTRQVMVRHRRSEVEVLLPQRLAETVLVTPDDAETALYPDVSRRIRDEARGASPARRLAMRGLAHVAGSSPAALAPTLTKVGWSDLAARARRISVPSKVNMLVDLLGRRIVTDGKVVVFTAFRHTLDMTRAALDAAGIPAAVYHGGLTRIDKERAVTDFRDAHPVLLTTESAGEGRNLQFCHVMVNIDLPWNPMRIEQRLGRLHRVGQTHDVVLTNLVGRGTIEERILRVLETKINLFELVVGELDMILGRIDEDADFADQVFDAFVASTDDGDFDSRMEILGDALAQARTSYLASRTAVDDLVGTIDEE